MNFSYDDIELEFVDFDTFSRKPVYDKWNVDLLYTEWLVGMLAYYSPTGSPVGVAVETRSPLTTRLERLPDKNTSPGMLRRLRNYLFGRDVAPFDPDMRRDVAANARVNEPPDNSLGRARSGKGFGPIVTDVTLRDRLMTPRKPLRIYGPDWSGIEEFDLVSIPREGEECDAIGGPFCLQCDIVSQSPMGFVVYLQYKFATLPCADAAQRLVLSHRYDAGDVPNDTGYAARKIEGEIVFNGAMIHTHNITPDAFRAQFFLPIPLGHQRKIDYVEAKGDGLTILYGYTDTDPTICFDPGDSGAQHLEISEKLGYYAPSMQNITGGVDFAPLPIRRRGKA